MTVVEVSARSIRSTMPSAIRDEIKCVIPKKIVLNMDMTYVDAQAMRRIIEAILKDERYLY